MIGGLFLMLSYFGCDQSQVQRYLTAKSVDEARHSLLMSALREDSAAAAHPRRRGVLVFVFYLFQTPPMLFNRAYDAQVAASPRAAEYAALEQEFGAAIARRRAAAARSTARRSSRATRGYATIRARRSPSSSESPAMRVIPTSTTCSRRSSPRRMPIGLVGLMIAAIFAAAMSASARRAERAGDGDDHRFLPAALRHRGAPTRTICESRRWRR